MRYLVLAARLGIGALFIYASIYKIFDPGDFSQAIRNYMLLPPEWTNIVAIILPWIEFITGSLLILGIQTRPAALVTTGLLAVFLVVLVYAYSIGLDIDCGCFSSAKESSGRIGPDTLLRDAGIFLVSLFILLADRGSFSIAPGRVSKPA